MKIIISFLVKKNVHHQFISSGNFIENPIECISRHISYFLSVILIDDQFISCVKEVLTRNIHHHEFMKRKSLLIDHFKCALDLLKSIMYKFLKLRKNNKTFLSFRQS